MHTIRLFAAICLAAILAGCLGPRLTSVPGLYTVTVQPVHTLGREIDAICVHPVHDRHPGFLVVFATGDDGWFGTSHAVFRHLAEAGYTIMGYSLLEALHEIARSGARISTARAAQELKDLYAQAKHHLGLPDTTSTTPCAGSSRNRPRRSDGCAESLMTCVPQSNSARGIGPRERAPYSSRALYECLNDHSMSQLARFMHIAAVLMAIAFFAVALRG